MNVFDLEQLRIQMQALYPMERREALRILLHDLPESERQLLLQENAKHRTPPIEPIARLSPNPDRQANESPRPGRRIQANQSNDFPQNKQKALQELPNLDLALRSLDSLSQSTPQKPWKELAQLSLWCALGFAVLVGLAVGAKEIFDFVKNLLIAP